MEEAGEKEEREARREGTGTTEGKRGTDRQRKGRTRGRQPDRLGDRQRDRHGERVSENKNRKEIRTEPKRQGRKSQKFHLQNPQKVRHRVLCSILAQRRHARNLCRVGEWMDG